MNWESVERDWKHFKGAIKHNWARLTDEHLDEIYGRREQLVAKVVQCYDVTKADAEGQVRDWESRNHDVFAGTAAEVRKHVGVARQ
jgi:uncharacterized protein YjbJ (UPF0337 family)